MAKVKIQGNASGTGVLTVTAPNTSTDRTITLPDSTGTILDNTSTLDATKLSGNLPAISAASLTNVPKDTTVGGRKNILINGGFDVWQRGTSFSHSSGKNFICDRWWVNPSSVVGTQTRQAAGVDGFNYALRVQRTSGQSGTGLIYLQTEMESADSMQFRGKKLTLSFYAKKGANFSQSNSQITSNVVTGTGTDQSLISGFTGGANVLSQNNTLTTSWQKFTHTTSSVLASNVNQIAVQFTHSPAGTAGADDYYYITGVQLEVGDTATDFEHRSYGEELALCQRYYYAWTSSGLSDNHYLQSPYGYRGSSPPNATGAAHHEFPTTMRTNPTVAGTASWSIARLTGNINGLTVQIATLASGNAYYLTSYTADAEL